jgi:hypothetical protein
MIVSDDQRVDKETFCQIFLGHWDGFKNTYPSYDTAQLKKSSKMCCNVVQRWVTTNGSK